MAEREWAEEREWAKEGEISLFLKECRLAGHVVDLPTATDRAYLIEAGGYRSWCAFRRDHGLWLVWGMHMWSDDRGTITLRREFTSSDELLSYLEEIIREWS